MQQLFVFYKCGDVDAVCEGSDNAGRTEEYYNRLNIEFVMVSIIALSFDEAWKNVIPTINLENYVRN